MKFELAVVSALLGVVRTRAGCFATNAWWQGSCVDCTSAAIGNQCPTYGYTPCFDTMPACVAEYGSSSDNSGNDNSGNDNSGIDDSSSDDDSGNNNSGNDNSGNDNSNNNPPPPNPSSSPSGQCWAPSGWSNAKCKICASPTGGNCPAYSWTVCYDTEAACKKGMAQTGGGASANCDAACPSDSSSLARPQFLGPNCYDSKYGAGFGPSWRPSGKTRIEKFIKNPSEMLRFITLSSTDDAPILNKSWKATGCKGAVAVFENIVCATELLQARNRPFQALNNAPGYTINDFLNSGDEKADKMELAGFFAHKMKETARLTIWEENANGYRDESNTMYPPGPGASYHGRGPVQISWNYNYGPFSEWYFGDKSVLLNKPEMVDPEGPMGFIAALWFWMTPRDFTSGAPISGSFRCRDALIHWNDGKLNSMYNDGKDYDSYSGLGLSVNVVNGGIECPGNSADNSGWRVAYFLTVADKLGIKFDHLDNPAACNADSFCSGLTRGCSSTVGIMCDGSDGICDGDTFYYSGWVMNCHK